MNKPYRNLSAKRYYFLKKGDQVQAEHYLKEMRKIPCKEAADENFLRVKYIRYADDFVIFISGSKERTTEIREKVASFLKEELHLSLNMEKTLITHMKTEKVHFLGYELQSGNANTRITKFKDGYKRRAVNGIIQLLVPQQVIIEKIKKYRDKNKPAGRAELINYTVLDILSQYNAEIRGLYNYYCLANNVSKRIYKFKYFHYQSLLKTIANKEKTRRRNVIRKYGVPVKRKVGTGTRNVVAVKYKTKEGEKTLTYFDEPIEKKTELPTTTIMNPEYTFSTFKKEIVQRLVAEKCELCKQEFGVKQLEVHHIRKLKDLKQKWKKRGKEVPKHVLLMSKMNRKTLVVCKECHLKIHKGLI